MTINQGKRSFVAMQVRARHKHTKVTPAQNMCAYLYPCIYLLSII